MTAHEDLKEWIGERDDWLHGLRLLTMYRIELQRADAAKIRNTPQPVSGECGYGAEWAADLIDPDVTT